MSVPSPIWPSSFRPQQYNDLPVLMAQVWFSPAATPAQTPVDPTFLGESRLVSVPSPIWPSSFRPQQYNDLPVVTAQV